MNCPRCGGVVPLGAKFCMNCGAAFDASLPPSRPKATTFLPFLIGMGVLAAVLLSLAVAGPLSLSGKQRPGSVLLPGTLPTASLQKTGRTQPNSLAMTGQANKPSLIASGEVMPDEIRNWLKHLKRIDDKRAEYNNETSQKLLIRLNVGAFNPTQSANDDEANADKLKREGEVQAVINDTSSFFSRLTKDFNSLPPPPACKPIAERYLIVLAETQRMLNEIAKLMSGSADAGLTDMLFKSYKRIDVNAGEADALVSQLCAKYREPNNYPLYVEKPGSLSLQGVNLPQILSKALGSGNSDEKAARKELQEQNR